MAIGLVLILAVMVIPMPPFMIDIFLTLGSPPSVDDPADSGLRARALDFSIFPSLLLITTLFRLASTSPPRA